MKRITLNLFALACAIAAPHRAWAEVTCPPTLAVEQKTSAQAADWAVTYSGYDIALAGVTIFEGPPAEQASLMPDGEQTTTDRFFQTWNLPGSGRGYWLQCEYANTTAQISGRLPANVSRCEVSYERNVRFGGEDRGVVRSVTCK